MTQVETVLVFLKAINSGDADRVAAMLTENHVFIDGLGQVVHGRETMRAGWRGYYGICPDYRVSHHSIFADGNQVAVFGEAGGTIAWNGKLAAEKQAERLRGTANWPRKTNGIRRPRGSPWSKTD